MEPWDNKEKLQELEVIKKNVDLIIKFKKHYLESGTLTPEQFCTKIETIFPSFTENYPVLYKLTLTCDDISILYKMIDKITSVCKGNSSVDDARNSMGEMLAEKFLYPKLGKPENKDKPANENSTNESTTDANSTDTSNINDNKQS